MEVTSVFPEKALRKDQQERLDALRLKFRPEAYVWTVPDLLGQCGAKAVVYSWVYDRPDSEYMTTRWLCHDCYVGVCGDGIIDIGYREGVTGWCGEEFFRGG